jgi:hypothetical protein
MLYATSESSINSIEKIADLEIHFNKLLDEAIEELSSPHKVCMDFCAQHGLDDNDPW